MPSEEFCSVAKLSLLVLLLYSIILFLIFFNFFLAQISVFVSTFPAFLIHSVLFLCFKNAAVEEDIFPSQNTHTGNLNAKQFKCRNLTNTAYKKKQKIPAIFIFQWGDSFCVSFRI